MKAVVRYEDDNRKVRQKTLQVTVNEPNAILTEFLKVMHLPRRTWVKTIKCGRYIYEWNGRAKEYDYPWEHDWWR